MAGQDEIDRDEADSITVESGTETPEQLQASLAAGGAVVEDDTPPAEVTEPAEEKPPVIEPGAEPAKIEPPPDTRSEFEQKVDELDPPLPNETAEQRTVRMHRGEKRILQLLSRSKAAEDELARTTAELARLKTTPAGQTPPTTERQTTEPTPPTVEHPPFTFQPWDQYSEAHPEATHEDYLDARGDARETWKAEKKTKEDHAAAAVRDAARRRDALETLDRDKMTRVEAYRQTAPDYDAAMAAAQDLPLPPEMHVAMAMSPIGPKIAHYLAVNREEHLRIAALPAARQFAEIGKLEMKLDGDAPVTSAAAPAAATPPAAGAATTQAATAPPATTPRAAQSRPTTAAPAPVREITGGAQPTRDSYALGNDGEDADAYIIQRQQERRQLGLGG